MRQRKTNLFFPNSLGLPDEESQSSQSDHEETILAAHPNEDNRRQTIVTERRNSFLCNLATNQTKLAQCVTIAIAALATYSYHNVGASVNVQVAIMTTITLVGASPFCKTHLTTASIGAFVGGQNIIGANQQEQPVVADSIYSSYLWLLVLSGGVGLIWTQFVTHPRIQLLDGYSGRLGSTTFIGMNCVMLMLWGPLGVVGWNRYYYGLVDVVHVAEEDSAPTPLKRAWSWSEEAELAIGYVLAVLWLGVLSGFTRLKHNQYIQDRQSNEDRTPLPLNNVLIPVLLTLGSIIIVNATNYSHAAGLYNGFAVGAYVGMASLQKIPSLAKFTTISLTAALWGLFLTPFFVGFAGKSGFTSMMGHITHQAVEKYVWKRIQYWFQRKQRLAREAVEEEQQIIRQKVVEEERIEKHKQEEEKRVQQKEPYHPPHKPSRKKELVLSTKQQRRQQQRLKQLQQKQIPKRPTQQSSPEAAPLRHRAWVATPAEGDGVWEHPQLHDAKFDVV